MRSLDTPEIHGYRADLGYRVYLDKALEIAATTRPVPRPDQLNRLEQPAGGAARDGARRDDEPGGHQQHEQATEATRSTSAPLRAARAMVPVTQVPTGNVKLHHVRAKGSPRRAVRTVIAAASASHIIAKPQVGTPYSRAKTAAPAAYGAGSTWAAWVPRFPAAVTDWPSGPSTIQQRRHHDGGAGLVRHQPRPDLGDDDHRGARADAEHGVAAEQQRQPACAEATCGISSAPVAALDAGLIASPRPLRDRGPARPPHPDLTPRTRRPRPAWRNPPETSGIDHESWKRAGS